MYACPCRYRGPIAVLREIRNAIVPYVAIIFLRPLRLLYSCRAAILSTNDAITNTSNRITSHIIALTRRSYRCPTCSRALINMDHYFRLLDVEVRRQPMPAPYDTWQTVILWHSPSGTFANYLVMTALQRVAFPSISLGTSVICIAPSFPSLIS